MSGENEKKCVGWRLRRHPTHFFSLFLAGGYRPGKTTLAPASVLERFFRQEVLNRIIQDRRLLEHDHVSGAFYEAEA
jgi:hypothetical protein